MFKIIKFIIVLILLANYKLLAISFNPVWSGYFKSYQQLFDYESKYKTYPENFDGQFGQVMTTASLTMFNNWNEDLTSEFQYKLSPYIYSSFVNSVIPQSKVSTGYRVTDLDDFISPINIGNFSLKQNLDRAFFTYTLPLADIYLGRQAFSFGVGKFTNPTDVFSPGAYEDLTREEKNGSDGLRIRVPLGDFSEIEGAFLAGENFKTENYAFYLRNRLYFLEGDFVWILMGFKENLLYGLNISRNLLDAGWWLETAFVDFKKLADYQPDKGDNYFRLTTGLDYTLENGLYLMLEYYYNSLGTSKTSNYLSNLSDNELSFSEAGIFNLGKHYLFLNSSYQFNALLSGNLNLVTNLTDYSANLSLYAEYNFKEDVYLDLGCFLPTGRRSKYSLNVNKISSEFGSNPLTFYTTWRIYF